MPLQAGQWYANAKVTGSVMGHTSTGKEQLAVTFETDDPKTPSVTKYLFFTDAAIDMTTKALVALGWKPEDYDYNVALLNGTDVLVGRACSLVLEVETYEGRAQTKVVFVNSAGGGVVKDRMSAEQGAAFSSTVRERLMRSRAAMDPAAVSAPKPAPAPAPTDAKGPCGHTALDVNCKKPGCLGASPF